MAKKVQPKQSKAPTRGTSQKTSKVFEKFVEEADTEDIEHVFAGERRPGVEDVGEPQEDEDGIDRSLVKVTIDVHLRIARVDYPPGDHVVERHMLPTILEMANKKRKADISIFTGKNYLVERLMNRALKVTEVQGEIDLKKLTKK